MSKRGKLSIILGSLIGAVAIQLVIQACDSGDGKANAAPNDCDKWMYMTWYVEGGAELSAGDWEPFAVTGIGCFDNECGRNANNTYAYVGLRRCSTE